MKKQSISKKVLANKKGFTLVELTVVMVIMVILAGIAVSVFSGIIDDMRRQAVITEGKSVFTAAQVVAAKKFGTGGYPADGEGAIIVTKAEVEENLGRQLKTTASLVKAESDPSDPMGSGGSLTSFEYTDGGTTVELDPVTGEIMEKTD